MKGDYNMSYKEVRIGALYPLTGENHAIGQSIRDVLEFYVNLVNYQDHVPVPPELKLPDLDNYKIKLIWADTTGDPLVAQDEAIRLIKQEGVTSIIGSFQSSVTSVVSYQTEIHEIPYLSPETDARILTQRRLKWFFRTGPTDIIRTKKFFDMMEEKGLPNTSIAALEDSALLGQNEADAVTNLSRLYEHDIRAIELYNPNIPITKQDILRIRNSNPDVLFTTLFPSDAIRTIRIFKELNYYPMAFFDQIGSFLTNEVLSDLDKDANFVISASSWSKGLTRLIPLAHQVNYMFKSKYGYDLNNFNSLSFTGFYTLIDAIARAGSGNPTAIRKALINTDISGDKLILPWYGVRFDKNGQNIFANSMLVQIINEIPKIIWPDNLAEANAVLPAPPWCKR